MQVFVFDTTSGQTAEELARFAQAIGANYDEGNIIYKGANSAMGFEMSLSENTLTVELTGFSESAPSITLDVRRGVNYENSGASIVFGGKSSDSSSDSSIVQCAIVPYNSPSGSGYAYLLNNGSFSYAFSDGTTATNDCYSDGSSVYRVPDRVVPTVELVSMAPLAIEEKFTQHAYVAYAAPEGGLKSTPFMLNSTRFIPLGGNLCIAMD